MLTLLTPQCWQIAEVAKFQCWSQVLVSALSWLLARFPRCLLTAVPQFYLMVGSKQQYSSAHLSQQTQKNVSFLFLESLENLGSIVCVQYQDQHILYLEVLFSVLCYLWWSHQYWKIDTTDFLILLFPQILSRDIRSQNI